MGKLKIVVWEKRDTSGEPDVEVTIPTYLAKWVPRMMKFMPKKAKHEVWGEDIDFKELNLEELIKRLLRKVSLRS